MIAGLQPCSFIDYPEYLSAVVFLRGCNLRCPYCHNPSLISPNGECYLSDDEFFSFLKKRQGLLDAVVISGGEPTLYADLNKLITKIQSMGFLVKLDTNGTQPKVIADLLNAKLLNYIALDLKDHPNSYASWLGAYSKPEDLLESISIIKDSDVAHEFRTTVVLPYHDKVRLNRMAKYALGCKQWILQAYKNTTTSRRFVSPPVNYLKQIAATICRDYGISCFYRNGN
ncbi:MAG: anaerobic ribonucleoside-triphosphate reductase activating protein [Deltaproteobacteria bacterium]|nr:anaerobic ribonucleoside-triphosphate reductase activating protein [Deltaproteobacteria bacterium]